jgi:hypothetical protein
MEREILEAALIGYEHQKQAIEVKIAQLKAHLGGHVAAAATAPGAKKGRRKFSAETRAKMAAAQQRRWAAKHQAEVPAPKAAAPKAAAPKAVAPNAAPKKRGPLSPEARQRIVDAQKKRWAAAKKKAK